MSTSTEKKIFHYQRSIDRSTFDKTRLLHCIKALTKLPVTVQLLEITGIGHTVNALSLIDDGVGYAAKHLKNKWKIMVANTDTSDEEDEACVSASPESNESPDCNFKPGTVVNQNGSYSNSNQLDVDRSESEPSCSFTNTNRKRFERKRKYDSSSSDEETNIKRKKLTSEQEVYSSNENHFMINDAEFLGYEKEQEEQDKDDEEKRHSNASHSRDKECSLNGASHSDKTKSKEKHHSSSSHSKVKSHESNDKSKKHEKHSSSKSNDRGKEEKHKSDKRRSKESSKSKSSHSSSRSKDHSRHRDKDKNVKDDKKDLSKFGKDEKNLRHEKSKVKENNKERKDHKTHKENREYKEQKDHKKNTEHQKPKEKERNAHKDKQKVVKCNDYDGGIDGYSETNFAETLGMSTVLPKNKKEMVSLKLSKSTEPEQSSSSQIPEYLPLLSNGLKLEPLSRIEEEIDLALALPEPSPHFKPLPHLNDAQRRQSEYSALTQVMYTKRSRTKVYSGNKCNNKNVPTLYEMCTRNLIKNINALKFTSGVPYDIIKPVLERATPDQLFMLEYHNPYLLEDSDSLWQFHCNKYFGSKLREEMESWREMYMRCLGEREAKLKTLTANIKQSVDKSLPVRSTKLAYVDNVVKPPRNVLCKQAKYGTANVAPKASDLKKELIVSAAGSSGESKSNSSTKNERTFVPPPPAAGSRAPPTSTSKKGKAPLMAKALQALRRHYKR